MDPVRDREALPDLLREVARIRLECERLISNQLAGGYRSAFRGCGIEFDEVREYVAGDSPRSIDWNVTARTGRPFVKKYVDERERSMVFLLDLSGSMDARPTGWTPRQVAARLIAILALAAVHHEDRVGLVGFGEQVEHFLPPRKGLRHALTVVRDALHWQAKGGESCPARALELVARRLRRRATVFLLSDFFAEDWSSALHLCRRRHDVIAVPLISPEWRQAPRGWQPWQDPEGGSRRRIDGDQPQVARAWEQAFTRWEQELHRRLRRSAVDRIEVEFPKDDDIEPLGRSLQSFFRTRQERLTRQ